MDTRNIRIFEALSTMHRGMTYAFRALNSGPKAEVENIRKAIEEIEKGIAVLRQGLAEAERELWNSEHLSSPPRRGRKKISKP